jgi:hypothetical protein
MASPGETYFQSNLNEKKHKIAIGENKLCLEIGSIINTEASKNKNYFLKLFPKEKYIFINFEFLRLTQS